ncbi:hypothetical protein Pcinc_015011 [Petrolisthes cinctipes]|uniref:Soluble interferon alpha/beta receptor OPG204 n=1 Tax=Petrolisthes cinctipes TaxID=88211 RepID=A0AAE1FV95_PETCI|nr:hypothetical protein Pcinc_015011 [Petrolisthes cinctipes]
MATTVGFPVIQSGSSVLVAADTPSILSLRHFGDYLLLGDSGYLLEPFLMTPVTNPTNEAEELYYRALVRTRVIVELTLGVVKNRFRCIHRFGGELQYTPLRSAKIVSACLLLHNRCVSRSIPDPNNHLPEEDMPIEAHVVGAGDRGGTDYLSNDNCCWGISTTTMASAASLAAKQSISYLLLTRWLALLFLLLPHSTLQDALQELVCPCKRESAKELMGENVLHDSVTEEQTRMLWCCAHILLKYNDPHFNITWSFKGEEYPWKQSSFETHPCGVEVLVTRRASLSDQGNYTCIITASDGTSITRSVDLSVHENKIYRDVPTDIHSTGDLIRPLGAKNVTFTCEGYVGDNQNFPFSWKQVNSKGNITFLTQLPNVTVLPPVGHEKLKSQFVISEVAEEHYGVYICTVINSFGSETINMTLIKGVPEVIVIEEKYRSLSMVAAGALVLVGMCVFLWLRCGPQISLCLQHTWPPQPQMMDRWTYWWYMVTRPHIGLGLCCYRCWRTLTITSASSHKGICSLATRLLSLF